MITTAGAGPGELVRLPWRDLFPPVDAFIVGCHLFEDVRDHLAVCSAAGPAEFPQLGGCAVISGGWSRRPQPAISPLRPARGLTERPRPAHRDRGRPHRHLLGLTTTPFTGLQQEAGTTDSGRPLPAQSRRRRLTLGHARQWRQDDVAVLVARRSACAAWWPKDFGLAEIRGMRPPFAADLELQFGHGGHDRGHGAPG